MIKNILGLILRVIKYKKIKFMFNHNYNYNYNFLN